jgi:hypothetical protein
MKTAALARPEPALDRRAVVRGVVIQNEVDVEIRGPFSFQLVEELDEILTAMAKQAAADRLPVQIWRAAKNVVVPWRW